MIMILMVLRMTDVMIMNFIRRLALPDIRLAKCVNIHICIFLNFQLPSKVFFRVPVSNHKYISKFP